MKKTTYILLFLLMIGLTAASALAQKSVITEKHETKAALDMGCVLTKDSKHTKHIDVLNCPDAVAANFQPNIEIYAADAGANTQIKANLLFSSAITGTGRKVAVLDTGYNYLHPELSTSYVAGKDFFNVDNDPMDDNGHGTHVAGLITADGIDANAKGVAPGTGIVAGKVLNAQGAGTFDTLIEGIYWAVDGPDGVYGTADDFKVDAISISINTAPPFTYNASNCDTVVPALTTAINYATSKNVPVVVAAGNYGTSGVSMPACITNAIAVGAVDSTDTVQSFSAKGPMVDVVAPGFSLYSTWTGTGYSYSSGTSMAAPVVSGTIALIKQKNPTYTSAQVLTALTKTTKDLGTVGFDTNSGFGRIDAYAAANYVPTTCNPKAKIKCVR